jgi:hypothetical protein
MRYAPPLVVLLLGGCDPLSKEILEELVEETANFELVNLPNHFYRRADHNNFKSAETYAWRNCGGTAIVDLEVEPSCPNDVTVNLRDPEGTLVFSETFHAPHCGQGKKDWPPLETAAGVPGVWSVELIFDISGVKDLEIRISGTGDCEHEVFVEHGDNGVGNGEDPQPPGQPPVNDGPATGPGVPGNQGGPFLLWRHHQVRDRDVEETYYLRVSGTSTSFEADWTSWSAGTLRVLVRDGAGLVTYERTLEGVDLPPLTDVGADGSPGIWSITFQAVDLEAQGLRVTVYAP